MRITHNADGTGLVAFTPGGDPLAVTDMSEAQRGGVHDTQLRRGNSECRWGPASARW